MGAIAFFNELFESDETERYKAIKDFYDKEDENIDFKTDLSKDEIALITAIEYEHDLIKSEFGVDVGLKDLTKAYKDHKVSENRKGRSEWVDVLRGEVKEDNESKIKKLLGL